MFFGTIGCLCACAGSDGVNPPGTTAGASGGTTAATSGGTTGAGSAGGTASAGAGAIASGGIGKAGSGGAESAFVWTRARAGTEPKGLWGTSALDVYAVASTNAWHGTGTNWQASSLPGSSSAVGVWGNAATEVFLLRSDGAFYQSSGGNAWALAAQQPLATYQPFVGLRGFASGTYAFGGLHGKANVQRREADGTWSTVYEGGAEEGQVWDVWGASADDFYVCVSNGGNGVYRRRGTPPFVREREGNCASLSGSSVTDVYVAGIAGLFHSHGDGQWDAISLPLASGEVPFVVFAQAPDAVFVGTNESTMLFFDGSEWTSIGRQRGGSHKVIWAPSPDEVYVGGLDGFWYGKRRAP